MRLEPVHGRREWLYIRAGCRARRATTPDPQLQFSAPRLSSQTPVALPLREPKPELPTAGWLVVDLGLVVVGLVGLVGCSDEPEHDRLGREPPLDRLRDTHLGELSVSSRSDLHVQARPIVRGARVRAPQTIKMSPEAVEIGLRDPVTRALRGCLASATAAHTSSRSTPRAACP